MAKQLNLLLESAKKVLAQTDIDEIIKDLNV